MITIPQFFSAGQPSPLPVEVSPRSPSRSPPFSSPREVMVSRLLWFAPCRGRFAVRSRSLIKYPPQCGEGSSASRRNSLPKVRVCGDRGVCCPLGPCGGVLSTGRRPETPFFNIFPLPSQYEERNLIRRDDIYTHLVCHLTGRIMPSTCVAPLCCSLPG